MTIAALRQVLDEEPPYVPRHPAPLIPHTAWKRQTMEPRPVPGPRIPQESPAATPQVAVGPLLTWAEQHSSKAVARKGQQARALLVELRQLHAADAALAAVDAEEQRLVERLAKLRERKETLRPQSKRKSPARDYVPSEVRAWARAAGRTDVPAIGTLPAALVQAWRDAHPGGAQ